jgi:hypothetical protein
VAQFDVYAHPDARLRERTPYLLDVQNGFLDRIATRVVIPLRGAEFAPLPMRDLNPVCTVEGQAMVLDTAALAELGGETDITRQVERLARLAAASGLRGLVCSPLEITPLRTFLPVSIQLVTPGIRTGAEKSDDQKRTLGPAEAMSAGANWLVVGRPIYAAADPIDAAHKMHEAARSGL